MCERGAGRSSCLRKRARLGHGARVPPAVLPGPATPCKATAAAWLHPAGTQHVHQNAGPAGCSPGAPSRQLAWQMPSRGWKASPAKGLIWSPLLYLWWITCSHLRVRAGRGRQRRRRRRVSPGCVRTTLAAGRRDHERCGRGQPAARRRAACSRLRPQPQLQPPLQPGHALVAHAAVQDAVAPVDAKLHGRHVGSKVERVAAQAHVAHAAGTQAGSGGGRSGWEGRVVAQTRGAGSRAGQPQRQRRRQGGGLRLAAQ